MRRIYLDNAASTPLHPEVIEVVTKSLEDVYGNPSAIHHHGRTARAHVESARKSIAQELRVSIGEIFFTSSATEATNAILINAVKKYNIQRIISSPTEHHCVLHTLDLLAEDRHVDIIYLEVDHNGNPNLQQLESLLSDKVVTLVSLMYVNNELGTILDLDRVSALCQEDHIFFHCDAVQAIGKIRFNLADKNIDYLTGSGHKLHAPKGVGFFYMNGDKIFDPYILGGAQERNMRAGTENIYAIIGLETALKIQMERLDDTRNHVSRLREYFKAKLSKLDAISFNGNQDDKYLPHILSVSFPASPKADMIMFNLDISGISASSGSACSSGIENDSHVLQAIGHPPQRKTIRFSFSEYNSLEEIDYVVDVIKKII